MGRYFIHLAYNGANYCGWQTQPALPTVQLTLEQALSTLLRQTIAVVGCGRTDTGVHASDFYAHFDFSGQEPLDCGQLVFKLNNLLPPDIAIFAIYPVAAGAHARFDATARTYQYHVSPLRLPFRQGLYARIYYVPDLDLMNRATEILMEYDDFTSFAKLHTQVKTNICHLTEAHWERMGDELVFTIRSNRFLRNMVRSVTGTLLDVGRGKLTLDGLRQIIEKKDRRAAGVSMPPQGLFLTKVDYPPPPPTSNLQPPTSNLQPPMKYIEVTFTMDDTGVFRDMLVDTLGNEGPYESFVETPDGLKAYVPQAEYDPAWLAATAQAFPIPLKYKASEMEDRNWNQEWERQHEAVLVRYSGGAVWVRAPFHPHRTDVDYELIIEPKMSFGTAHHPTTAMMLAYVAELPVAGKRVLDMGCGTAILAILTKMRGAAYAEGIDVDEWAFRNAQENAATNGVDLTLRLGDASLLAPDAAFDLVIANINRNILLRDMERYASVMSPGATLLLSGFYQADEGALIARANELGMTLVDKKTRDGWSALHLAKTAHRPLTTDH